MELDKIYTGFSCILILLAGCGAKDDPPPDDCSDSYFFDEYDSRNFEMGFSTWPYAPTTEAVEDTYQLISDYADVYSEHLDLSVPWDAWINGSPLPAEFINEIAGRKSRRIPNAKLTVSVSLLNSLRTDLATDYDGTVPVYSALNDIEIEDAYFNHLQYITDQLAPDYLIIAIEVNELLINVPDKWNAYKLLMANIRTRIRQHFPALSISEYPTQPVSTGCAEPGNLC